VLVWVLLLGMVGLLSLQGIEAWRSASRRLGLVPDAGERGILVTSVYGGQPADRAGLRAGDQILTVNGRPVANLLDYERAAQGYQRGRPVVLRIERAGEVLELAARPGVPPRWRLLVLNWLTALGFLAVALLALTRGLGDLRVRLLFLFAGAVALELALPGNAVGRPWLRTVSIAGYYLLTGLQIGVELHLASLIPERADWLRSRPWIAPLYYGAGLGVGFASCATFLVEEVLGYRILPWNMRQVDGLIEQWVLPVWALAITALLAAQALRQSEPRGRHQAGLVLAATIPWMLFVLTSAVLDETNFILPTWIGALETLILLGYPLAFFAAIFRYHLFDIELVVRRGLIYTTLTGALVLVFYAALGAGGAVFSHLVEAGESVWVVAGATLLLGLLFAPLRRLLHRLIDRRFFPERYALRQRLIALAEELPALGKLPRMGQVLVERLASIFLAHSATLLIANPETGLLSVLASTGGGVDRALLIELEDPAVDLLRRAGRPLPVAQLAFRISFLSHHGIESASLAVPLLNHDRLIGVLIVGGKQGSRTYPAEELDLLHLLAHHVGTVFENARLFESATYEGLTGLLRREAILEQLDRELERALRYGRPLTIAMADLDHFKEVNDRFGHLAGDSLLRRIGQVITSGLRSTDWIGRYGGEEFLVILPETAIAGAAAVAEKLRSLVQATMEPTEDGTQARVTISIGLAALSDIAGPWEEKVTSRDLIAAADRSLYEAKHAGRNRVCPWVA
jgi:diguanylate cyclase (GGDEF)-like protein